MDSPNPDTQGPPNACDTNVPDTHDPSSCEVTLKYFDPGFQVEKYSSELAQGSEKPVQLLGQEFELRVDDGGQLGASAPGNACVNPTSAQAHPDDAPGCWRFYPVDPGQESTWQAKGLEPGTYWLLETKAPSHQRVPGQDPEPVTGVQLLAEPVRIQVGGTDANNEIDVFKTGGQSSDLADRCEVAGDTRVTACVDESGLVLKITDPKLVPLPLTGAYTAVLLGLTGLGALAALLVVVYVLTGRKRRMTPLQLP